MAPEPRSFPRRQRLTRGAELERVRVEGKRLRSATIEARTTASLLPFSRVGFIVPRYKHTAVARNRLKRRLREVARLHVLPMLPPCDVVFRVFPSAYERSFVTLREEIQRLAVRLAQIHGVS